MRRIGRWSAILLALLLLIAGFGRQYLFSIIEQDAFIPPPAGTLTPDSLGVPSQQISFPSGDRILRGSYVQAANDAASAVLIFHGDEESISHWAPIQKRLYDNGVSSFVFDYSGYGGSSGKPSVKALNEDGLAAYARFVQLTPTDRRRYVLGFSLGAAVMLDVVSRVQPEPDGVVIASGFASTREVAVTTGRVPRWMAWVLPDVWNNEERVSLLKQPVLIIHSRADEVIPFEHAQRLCIAAKSPHRLVLLDTLTHDAPVVSQDAAHYWAPVVEFVRSGKVHATETDASSGCVESAR